MQMCDQKLYMNLSFYEVDSVIMMMHLLSSNTQFSMNNAQYKMKST